MAKDLHHAEDPNVYVGLQSPIDRPVPTRPERPETPDDHRFNLATPEYAIPASVGRDQTRHPYGGLIRPNRFDGNTDPRNWIEEFEYIAEANMWDNETKFRQLVTCLDGNTRIWFFNMRRKNPSFSWDTFVPSFLSKYGNKCEKILLHMKISRKKQQRNESFDGYWDSKLQLIETSAPEMSTFDKLNHLFNGLVQDLQNRVIEDFMREEPETVEELYNLIKVKSEALSFITPQQNIPQPKKITTNPGNTFQRRPPNNQNYQRSDYQQNRQTPKQRDPQIDELIQTLKINAQQEARPRPAWKGNEWRNNNGNSSPNNQRQYTDQRPNQSQKEKYTNQGTEPKVKRDMSNVMCYRCRDYGHFANDCPQPPRENQKNYQGQN